MAPTIARSSLSWTSDMKKTAFLGAAFALAALFLAACGGAPETSLENLKPFEADGYYNVPVKDQTLRLKKLSPDFFIMGETFDQGMVKNPEQRAVVLDGYALGTTEVSAPLWAAVMGGKSASQGVMTGISWEMAQKFVTRLSALTGIPFRLPTEAEWEYAARQDAGMPGGAWEWCADYWAETLPYGLAVNPQGPAEGSERALRGGSVNEKHNKPITRKGLAPYTKSGTAGLRVAVSTGEKAPSLYADILRDNKVPRETCEALKAESFTVGTVKFRMLPVRGGTFQMGATARANAASAEEDEFPVHAVTLDSFLLGETEVTAELWKAVMGSLPPLIPDGKYPVGNVSWYDAWVFILRLNALTGRSFRLPTEAEWEYAAKDGVRSGNTCFAGWDSSRNGTQCDTPDKKPRPVAGLAPNLLGLYDMSGNVWEWVQDRPGPYPADAQVNPTGPLSAREGLDLRVMRGGSAAAQWPACRVSNRGENLAHQIKSTIGFRLAL